MFDKRTPKALLLSIVNFVLDSGRDAKSGYEFKHNKSGLIEIGRKVVVPSNNGDRTVTVESLYSALATAQGWKPENCDLITVSKTADLFVHLGPRGKRRWPIDCVSNGTRTVVAKNAANVEDFDGFQAPVGF